MRLSWRVIGIAVLVLLLLGFVASAYLPDGHGNERYLHVEQVDEDEISGEVIAFEDLTPGQQAVFEEAVAQGNGNVEIPEDVNESVWFDTYGVRYQNQTYLTVVSTN
ncbi:hypothetical protein ACFQH6_17510 [Halobacteriaceae archaeon GCM10025711]